MAETLAREAAQVGLLYILVHLVSIVCAWWALLSVRFDVFLRNPKGAQAKMLQVMLAVIIGYQFAQFVLGYADWSSSIKGLFQ
ncbi:DUF1146 family protein [Marinicrinis sediminis]|uniref:DUF1146 family protein n=1 Tax=Marinicrinis sediminis TaxID=1652465 RepID=A0ABW5RAP6_9BACL